MIDAANRQLSGQHQADRSRARDDDVDVLHDSSSLAEDAAADNRGGGAAE